MAASARATASVVVRDFRAGALACAPWLLAGVGCGPVPSDRGPREPLLPHGVDLAAAPDRAPRPIEERIAPATEHRPLLALGHRCADRRTPRLAGAWVLGCDALGRVALAERLADGLRVELSDPAEGVGVAPDSLAAAATGALWRLPDPNPGSAFAPPAPEALASPAFDGAHLAIVLPGRVAISTLGERVQASREAAPLPWFPPALSWPTVLWIDERDQAQSGLDIWRWDAGAGAPRPWVTRPGDQRHVVAADGWAAWLDDEGVWLERLADGARWLHRAEVGFRAPPSLWHGVACWEERDGGESDVACTDGMRMDGEGDQGWPSRWGPWLLFRQGDDTWLATARELTFHADDPHVERLVGGAGFRVRTAWPAPGWCAEVAQAGTWSPAGPVPTGASQTWSIPGEALRLRPGTRGVTCPGETTL